ncbi:MAG TPA: hypothetical protein VGP84_23475, partial [Gemmatimonadaceae bacterium]|nr:hypothetical protein [Gemmatimonadaceae bacterium]
VLGTAIAFATTRLLGDLLFRVGPRDPAVFAAAIVVMVAAAAVACAIPAWRASRLDPIRALRV